MNGLIEFILSGITYHNSYGKLEVTPAQLSEGVASFNGLPDNERRLPIKYGKHDQGTDAAGWITGLVGVPQDKPEKVLATVEWTDIGSKAIKEKRQRYISPEFSFNWANNKTGKKGFSFLGAALLNDPHMTELAPAIAFSSESNQVTIGPSVSLDSEASSRVALASDGVITMEAREKMCTMLGLEASASDDAIMQAIADLQKAKQEKETEIEVELSARGAKDAEVVALTAQVTAKDEELGKLKIELAAATEAAQAAASEKLDIEAKTATEALIAQGKALPREREILLSAYKKDPEGSKSQWALRGKVIELSTASGVSDPVGLSGLDLAVATQTKMMADGATPAEAAIAAMQLAKG